VGKKGKKEKQGLKNTNLLFHTFNNLLFHTYLAHDECIEYQSILHLKAMGFSILLRKNTFTAEVQNEKNCNLINSLR